jgi:hypothetical protein
LDTVPLRNRHAGAFCVASCDRGLHICSRVYFFKYTSLIIDTISQFFRMPSLTIGAWDLEVKQHVGGSTMPSRVVVFPPYSHKL